MSSLQELFLRQNCDDFTEFESSLSRYLSGGDDVEPMQHFHSVSEWDKAVSSLDGLMSSWKTFLAHHLLADLAGSSKEAMATRVRTLERRPWDSNVQYLRAIIALNHALANMPALEAAPHLLQSGAALIDSREYCSWLSLPFTPQHFEFGTFLAMLSLLTPQAGLKEAALQMAKWQLNTLDADAKPIPGLFVREKEGKGLYHLTASYALFLSASKLESDFSFGALAEKTLRLVQVKLEAEGGKIDPLFVLIEKWVMRTSRSSLSSFSLPAQMYDPSTAVVGHREAGHYVVCTLHGVQTGLGGMRWGDVEVVTYGPCALPLDDSFGFGIEGNALSDKGERRSLLELKRGSSFAVKGCVRLADRPTRTGALGKFQGIWLDIEQEYKAPHFFLRTKLLGLDGWEDVAIGFFVRTKCCHVGSSSLHPRKPNRYEGVPCQVVLEGMDQQVTLTPPAGAKKMEVIPLSGGDDFWGADFLIAYPLVSDQRTYEWRLNCCLAKSA